MKSQNKAKYPLDKTLRFMYCTLRIEGGKLVAIEFRHKGKRWRADTPEEAIQLRELLESGEKEYGLPFEEEFSEDNKWTPDRFLELLGGVGDHQTRFLAILVKHRDQAITAEEMSKELEIGSLMGLAGVQSGLAKRVRALGLEPNDLYQVWIDWTEGKRTRYLKISKDFCLAAEAADWSPEKYLRSKK